MTFENIKLNVAPPSTNEIGAAYARLALGLSQKVPGLLNAYVGPEEWLEAILAEPPDLLMLRHHAEAVATAAQKSQLQRNRKERLLRNVRGLLCLIRVAMGEQIMFTEQVRMLLDLRARSFRFQGFAEWATWQATYTMPVTTALPLLSAAVESLRERLAAHPFDLETRDLLTQGDMQVVAVEGDGVPFYQQGQLCVPEQGTLRVDRLYHLAARLGYGGTHTMHTAMRQRYAAGEAECAVLLNFGPDQVIVQGLYESLLPKLDLYATAIPALLQAAGLPANAEQLRRIHAAEELLECSKANAALLLHQEKMRSRDVRSYLARSGLMTRQQAGRLVREVADPLRAAHVFAPLIGGILIQQWLRNDDHSISALLTDPPVPSRMDRFFHEKQRA